jgi:hypothetical protein
MVFMMVGIGAGCFLGGIDRRCPPLWVITLHSLCQRARTRWNPCEIKDSAILDLIGPGGISLHLAFCSRVLLHFA